jgi:hypothetical protein
MDVASTTIPTPVRIDISGLFTDHSLPRRTTIGTSVKIIVVSTGTRTGSSIAR